MILARELASKVGKKKSWVRKSKLVRMTECMRRLDMALKVLSQENQEKIARILDSHCQRPRLQGQRDRKEARVRSLAQ